MRQLLLILSLISLLSRLAPVSHAARVSSYGPSSLPIKAVNLGGWLVTEGWITPTLFDNIPVNKDLLDGTQIQLQSVTTKKYLSAENGGGSRVVANKPSASTCETFKLWRIADTTFQFRALNWQFVGLDYHGKLAATSITSDDSHGSHTFEIVRKYDCSDLIRIRAPNGSFLQVNNDATVTADYHKNTNWGDDDPSVFRMTSVNTLHQGEFQVTNGYGPHKAASVMKDHWNSFIVEDDFKFIAENGLTAVRIPVGWWIRFDRNPPRPFVAGSLQALDNAFSWAEKYNLKVIIDLHAAPGSQNGWEHSGTRDGLLSWGQTDDNIDQTVAVIDFLASRYANRSGLYAIELINEPLFPGVHLDRLKKYYRAGYETVRKHSRDAFVIMSNRVETNMTTELIHFASGFSGAVVDVHYYQLFTSEFESMSVQQHIDFVKHETASNLSSLLVANGPPIFVGEWVNEMNVMGASKRDYQRFGSAQVNVYKMATFGWSYWTLKAAKTKWSLEWMIKNDYISL